MKLRMTKRSGEGVRKRTSFNSVSQSYTPTLGRPCLGEQRIPDNHQDRSGLGRVKENSVTTQDPIQVSSVSGTGVSRLLHSDLRLVVLCLSTGVSRQRRLLQYSRVLRVRSVPPSLPRPGHKQDKY